MFMVLTAIRYRRLWNKDCQSLYQRRAGQSVQVIAPTPIKVGPLSPTALPSDGGRETAAHQVSFITRDATGCAALLLWSGGQVRGDRITGLN
jgi:hypothetical protein